MNLEQKARNYSQRFLSEKETSAEDFTAGYNECKSDLIDFIRANPKSTAEQILKHMEEIV